MHRFDLKNVVSFGDLTCLFAKAIIDESKLWHRRLGHVNFKTMNKLVNGNLVRGLPSKTFENDHTYVACQKGKQHKASCKTKLVSSISQPLEMLHKELFGPTFVRSINHKTYCLLVTNDFSSYTSSDEKAGDDTADAAAGKKTVQQPASENEQALRNVLDKMMDQEKEATKQSDAIRKEFETQCNSPAGPSSGPSFVPFGGSFPIDVNDLPDDPLMPDLDDTTEVQSTGIFGSAYDDDDLDTYNYPYADQSVGAEADFNNMEPSTVEPTKITQALDDESWVKAMQEELLQFKIQKVWTIVDLPYGKKAIGTKWVYRNKKDEMGRVVRNKIDVKSAFLYGTIEDDVYVSQPPGFVDPEFPEKVYKVEKALYGLHQALRACIRTTSTLMETNKDLTKDEDGEDVDVHLYKSMIGSLMYLTSSRPDIMFLVCACSRFQVQPKVSHLNVVKRIFRHLKGASLDRKSTIGAALVEGRLVAMDGLMLELG
ncbi:ribonuclease H-like domain-containing protein [Tanacetum coccineum]